MCLSCTSTFGTKVHSMLKLFVSYSYSIVKSFTLKHGNFHVILKESYHNDLCMCKRARGDIHSILPMKRKHQFFPCSFFCCLTRFIFIVLPWAFISMSIPIIVEQVHRQIVYGSLLTQYLSQSIFMGLYWGNEFRSTLYHFSSLFECFVYFFFFPFLAPFVLLLLLSRSLSLHPEDRLLMSHGNHSVVFCTLTLSLRFYVNSQVNDWMMVIVSEREAMKKCLLTIWWATVFCPHSFSFRCVHYNAAESEFYGQP